MLKIYCSSLLQLLAVLVRSLRLFAGCGCRHVCDSACGSDLVVFAIAFAVGLVIHTQYYKQSNPKQFKKQTHTSPMFVVEWSGFRTSFLEIGSGRVMAVAS